MQYIFKYNKKIKFCNEKYESFFVACLGKGKVIPLHVMEAHGVKGGIARTHS
jgi:hypothetical protein